MGKLRKKSTREIDKSLKKFERTNDQSSDDAFSPNDDDGFGNWSQ